MSRAALIEEAAARWIVRRAGDDWSPADEQALTAWLDEHMAHRASFWRLEHGWNEADRIGALGRRGPSRRPLRRFLTGLAVARTRPVLTGALAATLAMTVGLGSYAWRAARVDPTPARTIALRTSVGAQRTVALGDGSRIELNTATLLRTTERPDGREVWLDRGEAFFDIAHRADRPFVVHAGPRTVTVLGTRFSVRRDGDTVTVAVSSGRVRVADTVPSAGSRAALIGAGDIAITQPQGTLVAVAAPARVEAMTAWRDGMLVFDDMRLAAAVAEFNRYTNRPIRIDDPQTADIRIGGAFRTDNSDNFLSLLHSAYGLTIRTEPDRVVVERRR